MCPKWCDSVQDFQLDDNHKAVVLNTVESHLENWSVNFIINILFSNYSAPHYVSSPQSLGIAVLESDTQGVKVNVYKYLTDVHNQNSNFDTFFKQIQINNVNVLTCQYNFR